MINYLAAGLIVAGCGGVGMLMASEHKREVEGLRQFIRILDFMYYEVSCKLTPIPEICTLIGEKFRGPAAEILSLFGNELLAGTFCNSAECMQYCLKKYGKMNEATISCLQILSENMDKFDLQSQMNGICRVRDETNRCLEYLSKDQDIRIRSYQTLGLCAGAAIAILLV